MPGPRWAACRAGTGGGCRAGAGSTRGAPERGVIGKPPAGLFAFWWALGPIFVYSGLICSGPAGAAREAVAVVLGERLRALIEHLLGGVGVAPGGLEEAPAPARAPLLRHIALGAGVSPHDP